MLYNKAVDGSVSTARCITLLALLSLSLSCKQAELL
jgi:hypothetical protein